MRHRKNATWKNATWKKWQEWEFFTHWLEFLRSKCGQQFPYFYTTQPNHLLIFSTDISLGNLSAKTRMRSWLLHKIDWMFIFLKLIESIVWSGLVIPNWFNNFLLAQLGKCKVNSRVSRVLFGQVPFLWGFEYRFKQMYK